MRWMQAIPRSASTCSRLRTRLTRICGRPRCSLRKAAIAKCYDDFFAMHRDESFDRNHAIDEALSQLIEMPLHRFERSYLEIAVRTLTGEHALRNGIVPIFKPTRRFDFDLWVLLINRLGSVHGRLQSDQRDMAAERM